MGVEVARPFATAGGKNKEGIAAALAEAERLTQHLAGERNKFAYFALKCRYYCLLPLQMRAISITFAPQLLIKCKFVFIYPVGFHGGILIVL